MRLVVIGKEWKRQWPWESCLYLSSQALYISSRGHRKEVNSISSRTNVSVKKEEEVLCTEKRDLTGASKKKVQ